MAAAPRRGEVARGVRFAGGGIVVRASGEPEAEESEKSWRLWLEAPDRLRAEFAVGTETVTAWLSGGTWWSWSPSQGARTNEGRQNFGHGKGPGEVLVSPAQIAHVLDLEPLGSLRVLSRPAYRLRARPFAVGDFALHRLGSGADEYDLVVDADRGFLLRAEARLRGAAFRVLEMTEVAVDEDIPADIFTPRAPEGEHFEFFEPWRRLELEELPGAVPFKVFVPAKAPGQHPFVQVRNPEPRRGTPIFVIISYSVPKPGGGHGNLWVNESAELEKPSAVPNPNETWRQVDDLMVGVDNSMGELRCKVLLKREGTHIRLESTAMAVHELVALARSLVPLTPGEPPLAH
jgi:hypothetical protein